MDADEAVDGSLTLLLPSHEVDEVLAMLRGELDERLSLLKPFDGQHIKSGLVESGDTVWHKCQALRGWPARGAGMSGLPQRCRR